MINVLKTLRNEFKKYFLKIVVFQSFEMKCSAVAYG